MLENVPPFLCGYNKIDANYQKPLNLVGFLRFINKVKQSRFGHQFTLPATTNKRKRFLKSRYDTYNMLFKVCLRLLGYTHSIHL